VLASVPRLSASSAQIGGLVGFLHVEGKCPRALVAFTALESGEDKKRKETGRHTMCACVVATNGRAPRPFAREERVFPRYGRIHEPEGVVSVREERRKTENIPREASAPRLPASSAHMWGLDAICVACLHAFGSCFHARSIE
jgi:hypothetical protein